MGLDNCKINISSIISNLDIVENDGKSRKLMFFIPAQKKISYDFSESFSIPLCDQEFSVSSNYILIGNSLSFKVYSYNRKMTLKLITHFQFHHINFMIRNYTRSGRMLAYKIILALYEQGISLDCKIYCKTIENSGLERRKFFIKSKKVEISNLAQRIRNVQITNSEKLIGKKEGSNLIIDNFSKDLDKNNGKDSSLQSNLKNDDIEKSTMHFNILSFRGNEYLNHSLIEILSLYLDIGSIEKVDYFENYVQITYKSGLKISYDSHMQKCESFNNRCDNKVLLLKNKIQILEEDGVVFEKKIKGIMQYDCTEDMMFFLLKNKIFVGRF